MPDTTVRCSPPMSSVSLSSLSALGHALGGERPWRRADRSSRSRRSDLDGAAPFGAAAALRALRRRDASPSTVDQRRLPLGLDAREDRRRLGERAARPAPRRRPGARRRRRGPSWRRISRAAVGHRRARPSAPPSAAPRSSRPARRRSSSSLPVLVQHPGLRLVDLLVVGADQAPGRLQRARRVERPPTPSAPPASSSAGRRSLACAARRQLRADELVRPSTPCGSAGCRGRCRGPTGSAGTAPRR